VDNKHVQHLIDGYLDGEFDLATSLEIQRHLEGCPDCRAAGQERSALSQRLRAQAPYFALPPKLEAAVRARLDEEDRRARPAAPPTARRAVRWLAAAAALVLAAGLGAGGALWAGRPGPEAGLAREVAASHIRALLVDSHRTDVASSDEHTVKPWFNGKLDYAPPVNDWTREGFPLVGGRLDYVGGRTVSVMVYRHRQHLISLYVWPAAQSGSTPHQVEDAQGFHLLHWRHGGMAYWMVSDLNVADLEAFHRRIEGEGAPGQG
jgi:anti-sigma factor RsiW